MNCMKIAVGVMIVSIVSVSCQKEALRPIEKSSGVIMTMGKASSKPVRHQGGNRGSGV